jgi:N-hydroxyarylamine O-acetyltransferase
MIRGADGSMDVDAYLERIGVTGPVRPTREDLARLQLAHLLSVPFENLDIPAGRPISLDQDALFDKIVRRRRGGFCYELNGLFARLLELVGFPVTLLSARVIDPFEGTLGPEFDHLLLRVECEGTRLVDVGYGESARQPVALRAGAEHTDRGIAAYRLERDGDVWELLARTQATEEWRAEYRFDLTPRRITDFAATCSWQQTDSPFFSRRRICTIARPDGRLTLLDDRLIVRRGDERTERQVVEDEVPTLLREHFGIASP